MRFLIASALTFALAVPAFAAFEGPGAPTPGGVAKKHASSHAVDTVAKALKARDDAHVVLEGRIVSAGPKHEEYVFEDATGKIIVEIDDKDFRGLTVTPENVVRIWGEVDTKHKRDSEIDVDRIEIVK